MAELNTTNITGSLSLNHQEIFSLIYPIGSIYMSVNSTNPSLLFGGTWEEFSKGRVLIGVDTSNTTFEESEKIGGASTINLKHSHTVGAHTHSIPSHTHTTGSHTLTLSEIPAHTHAIYSGYGDIGSPTMSSDAYRYQFWGGSNRGWHDGGGYGTSSKGGGESHNHGDTGASAVGTSGESSVITTSSSNSSTQNIINPYTTCYMWKRIA